MKQIPIIFSSEMVRALLNGTKTQTRRIVKMRDGSLAEDEDISRWPDGSLDKVMDFTKTYPYWQKLKCPYGEPGDLLYVRETHYRYGKWNKNGLTRTGKQKWRFVPDSGFPNFRYQDDPPARVERIAHRAIGWYRRASIFMPKEFTRLWLEVAERDVERLQDISEADALAEGIDRSKCSGDWNCPPSEVFMELWTRINGKESTDANPFVWKITFEVVSTTGIAGISEKKLVTEKAFQT